LLVSRAGEEDLIQPANTIALCIDSLLGLCTGALLSSLSSTDSTENFGAYFWGILVGGGILWLAWILPVWFPSLKLNEYGFELDLRGSPSVLWMGVAFILGYYQNVTLLFVSTVPAAFLNKIKKYIKAGDFKRAFMPD
jgi:hypothetical protein